MTIAHAYDEIVDRKMPVLAGQSIGAVKTVLKAIAGRAACLGARILHIWTIQRRIARFSVYRLQDIGFDRDWDGSLILANGGSASFCSEK